MNSSMSGSTSSDFVNQLEGRWKSFGGKFTRSVALVTAILFATGCAVVPHHGVGPKLSIGGELSSSSRHGSGASLSLNHDAGLVLSHGYKRHGRHGGYQRHGRHGGSVSIHHGGPGVVAGLVAGAVLVALLVAGASHNDDDHGHEHN